MATTLPELERLLSALATASRVTKYYPAGHPQIEDTLGRVLDQIASLVAKGSPLALSVLPDGLYVGPARVFCFSPADALFRNLMELGVRELVLSPGIDSSELLHLVESLTEDPKKIWEKGGLARTLKLRKALHIGVTSSDLTAAERQATLDSLRAVTVQERERTVAVARDWLDERGPLPSEDEILRIIALVRDTGSLGELIDARSPEGHDRRQIGVLMRLWAMVAKSGLDVPSVEATIAAEIFATEARTLMDAASGPVGGPSLPKLMERLGPEDLGDMIASRVDADFGDATVWLTVTESLFRRPGTRRAILYRILQKIRDRPNAADTVALLHDELVDGTKEESAFLALMRGTNSQIGSSPASWGTRWDSGILVRRASGLLERVGLSEGQRVRWLSSELDRLIEHKDIAGVLEVLEATRDRQLPQGDSGAPGLVSRAAHRRLPPFLKTVSPPERIRTIKALTSVDPTWRELVGRLLDLAEAEEMAELTAELESVGIDAKELAWEIMRNENPEDIARGIRIAGVLACDDDLPILLGFLQHGNPAIRMETIGALARVAPEDLMTHVPMLLRDMNPLVSMRTLDAVQRVPTASAHLVAAAQKGLLRAVPEEIGCAVIQFVAARGTPEQKMKLAECVLSPRFVGKTTPHPVREAATSLLGTYRPRGILGRLTDRSHREDADA
ncbi:hypothetical protein JXA88_17320 [Candidatus Fermentibacteria bacterium]|nr:hypothetical protein [Candidatus Fermentibacteria bacterium]